MICAHIKNSHDIISWSRISFLSLWDRKYSCHLLAPSPLGLSTSTLWVSGWFSPAPCSVDSPCTPDTVTVIPGHLRKCRKSTRFGTTSFSHVRRWHGQACLVSGRKVLVPVETQQVGTTRLDTFHCSQVFDKTWRFLDLRLNCSDTRRKVKPGKNSGLEVKKVNSVNRN